jgi:hypothetical protein
MVCVAGAGSGDDGWAALSVDPGWACMEEGASVDGIFSFSSEVLSVEAFSVEKKEVS